METWETQVQQVQLPETNNLHLRGGNWIFAAAGMGHSETPSYKKYISFKKL